MPGNRCQSHANEARGFASLLSYTSAKLSGALFIIEMMNYYFLWTKANKTADDKLAMLYNFFTPDDLENWLSSCPFGTSPDPERELEKQRSDFEAALVAKGFKDGN
ncbi:hypothetical protein G3N59_03785 [Paraburkholderia sp. Ac-20340]|uniref:hypothetical protein n=1 Tax=Paraburkholderia sp. Ac-20340 TaxID=2703888 RepID=UPI00197F7DCE|nr:hypothetical protein [Paraburkholderia sp. Ac-20340]MBN3852495.1 hypothetical protein [Paraburkholderia sp. Ac-20340]